MDNIPDTYYLELKNAFNDQNQNVINQIFNKIEAEFEKNRKEKSVNIERRKIVWADSKLHFNAEKQEELADLIMIYDDNIVIFQLASIFSYEPVMKKKFEELINNLSNIRKIKNLRFTEVLYAESHLDKVRKEKDEYIDLMRLLDIAKSVNYTEGIKDIADRLKKISPNLVDDFIPENSETDTNDIKR